MGNVAGSLTYDTKMDTSGLEGGLQKAKDGFSTAGDWFKRKLLDVAVNGTQQIIGALINMGKQAVESFAEYEQVYDGMKSIFKNSANQAELVAKATETANGAWKDMTMSYNDYYNKFNSTYPLIKSSIEDENEAMETTNKMLQLESDLANTFGYDMETASNAINWALKGTWSYIDNLNIGIKGTKEGFLEAAHNAGYMVDSVDELSSADILDILEKTADQFGVIGKTADEAGKTIQGSTKMMKAAWDNLLVAFAEGDTDKIKETFDNLLESVGKFLDNLLPIVTNVIDSIIEYLPSLFEKLLAYLPELMPIIVNLVNGLVQLIIQNLPLIVQCGMDLLIGLVLGLAQAIPDLIPVIVEAVMTIVDTLLDNLDLIIEAGIDLILALIFGIVDALPQLLEKLPEIIEKIVLTLTDPNMIAKLIKAGIQILLAVITGILETVGTLLEKVRTLPSKIFNAIKEKLKDTNWKQLGSDILGGILEGLTKFGNRIKEAAKKIFNEVKNRVKSFFGISSPAKAMMPLGGFITQGVAVGIEAETDSIDDAIDDINDDIMDKMTKAVNIEAGSMDYSGTNGTITQMLSAFGTTTVVNENKLLLDGDQIYENQQVVTAKKNLQTQFGGGYNVSS